MCQWVIGHRSNGQYLRPVDPWPTNRWSSNLKFKNSFNNYSYLTYVIRAIQTIRLGATPSGLSGPPPSSPIFMPDTLLPQPSQFVVVWNRHQIIMLACIPGGLVYPVVACWHSHKLIRHFSYVSAAVGAAAVPTTGSNRNSQVMNHAGHGQVHWMTGHTGSRSTRCDPLPVLGSRTKHGGKLQRTWERRWTTSEGDAIDWHHRPLDTTSVVRLTHRYTYTHTRTSLPANNRVQWSELELHDIIYSILLGAASFEYFDNW